MSGLAFLYKSRPGRVLLRILISPTVSKAAGWLLSKPPSRLMVRGFIKRNNIDMSDYAPQKYISFNDFFTRKLKEGARPVDFAPQSLISPCDGRLSAYKITDDCRLKIKGIDYTAEELVGSSALSQAFNGGLALIFRLCVDDYHRYCYFDSGQRGDFVFIPGVFHTVRPIALENTAVFAQNSREYCVINSRNFGRCLQMEVGAMMVGKIQNNPKITSFARGDEKGMFLFGGSTVVLLLPEGVARLRPDIDQSVNENIEIKVLMGEKIGEKI